jgi:hypothetical protein
LLVVEAVDGVRLLWPVLAALAVGVALVVASDVDKLDGFSGVIRNAFAVEASLLRRAQCDPHLPAAVSLDPAQAPVLTAGPYRAAVAALGSPPGQSC